jgi:hypothetical protein
MVDQERPLTRVNPRGGGGRRLTAYQISLPSGRVLECLRTCPPLPRRAFCGKGKSEGTDDGRRGDHEIVTKQREQKPISDSSISNQDTQGEIEREVDVPVRPKLQKNSPQ